MTQAIALEHHPVQLWSGRVLTTIAVLFLAFDAAVKLLQLPMAVEGTRSGRRSERLNHAEGEDHSS